MKIIQMPANAGYGGMPLHVLALARGLVKRGHEVEILSMSDGPMIERYEAVGLPVSVVPALGRKMSTNPLTWFRVVRFLRDTISVSRPDIVHSHGPRAHIFAGLALRGAGGVPLVATAHGSFTQFALGHEQEFSLFRSRLRKLEYRGADWLTGRLADRFVAVSEANRHDLVEGAGAPPRKVVVVHNGIEEQRVDEAQWLQIRREFDCDPSDKLVVFVGRLAFHKGVSYLMEAATVVAGSMPDARFVVVGEGPMEAELRRMAGRSPLAGRLFFAGRRSDAVDIIAAADLFVLPSLSEGLPLTLLEAAMCGRSMVATDVGGAADVVRENETGVLVPPRDAAALAAAMEQLLADTAGREGMGTAARRLWQREFTAELMVNKMEKIYSSLSSRNQRTH